MLIPLFLSPRPRPAPSGCRSPLRILSNTAILAVLPLPIPGNRKGVNTVEFIIGFLVSVVAGIASHYICKWLDRHRKGQ